MRPAIEMNESNPVPTQPRLEPMLVRLPPDLAGRLRRLARATRIRQSDYLREAVSDLLTKYGHVTIEEGGGGQH